MKVRGWTGAFLATKTVLFLFATVSLSTITSLVPAVPVALGMPKRGRLCHLHPASGGELG
jgi:hypothetical protein